MTQFPLPPIRDVVNTSALTQDDATVRSTMRLIQRAVKCGWDIPDQVLEAVPSFAVHVLTDSSRDTRDRIRAAELLASLRRDNMDRLDALAKASRLDAGMATDRVEMAASLSDEQIRAVGKSIAGATAQPKQLP